MNIIPADIDALEKQFASLEIVKKRTSQLVLEDYFRGKNVDDYINYLERVLSGEELLKFHNFSFEEIQATLLLFLLHYVQEERPSCLLLITRAAPYYFLSLRSQDEEECIASITSPDIKEAIKWQKGEAMHLAGIVVSDFLKGKKRKGHLPSDERYAFYCFLREITCKNTKELSDTFARAFVDWNRIAAAPIHDVIAVYNSYANSIGSENRCALLSHVCRLEKSPDVRSALTVSVLRIAGIVEREKKGDDIEEEVTYLASLLFRDVMPQAFEAFSNSEIRNCLKLFLHLFEKTQDEHYFTLMLYILPYCAEKPHKITFKIHEKEVSLLEYLLRTGVQIAPQDALDALKLWYDNADEWAEKVKPTVRSIEFFCALMTEGKNTLGMAYDFLHTFSECVSNPVELLEVLYSLRHDDFPTDFDWIAKLNAQEIECLVHILNLPTFPMRRREKYFSFFLKTNFILATRLTPQLSQDMIAKILGELEKSKHAPLMLAAIKNLMNGLAYSKVRDIILPEIAKSDHLRSLAQLAFFVTLEEPGIQVVAMMTKSKHFPENFRQAILHDFLSPNVAPKYWRAALYYLKPSDTTDIAQFLTNIRSKQEEVQELLERNKKNYLAEELTDAMIRLLLEEGTAKAIRLGAELIGKLLPLSALRRFLKKAISLPPKEAHDAISPLFKAFWFNDPPRKENNPAWFTEKKVQNIPKGFFTSPRRGDFRPTWYECNQISVFTSDDEIFDAFVERLTSLGFDRQEIIEKLLLAIVLEHIPGRPKAKSKYRSTLLNQHCKKTGTY